MLFLHLRNISIHLLSHHAISIYSAHMVCFKFNAVYYYEKTGVVQIYFVMFNCWVVALVYAFCCNVFV